MASSPPNPRQGEGGPEIKEEASGERAATPQKTFVAPPASQLPTKLHYVALGAAGPSGSIKQCFRTVKAARRVPTLPSKPKVNPDPAEPGTSTEHERRTRRDRSKRHGCTSCEKRFSSPAKLSQHMLSHTGELPFSCENCEKRFNSKFKLARHSLIHSEAKAFACNICGKTFNRKDHLTNHVRVHNPVKKLFKCDKPDCRKSYTSFLSYRKHAALHSAEEGDLQCKICDEVFNTRDEIVYHLKVHTGSRTSRNETDKKFTCDYCDRKFFTAKDVRRHLVVHTGRRDFLCPYCPQKFGRKDHLVRHVKNAHPEESWKSAAVGTSSEPPPEVSAFEETYSSDLIQIGVDTSYPSSESGRTRVPSSDIIVEIPHLEHIKEEPLDIKLETPTSPQELLPVDYPVYIDLPYMATETLSDPLDSHLLVPENVQSLLMDPGEGPSALSDQMLELLEESESTYTGEEGQRQQRLPAFKHVFQTERKPPPPPPPPH